MNPQTLGQAQQVAANVLANVSADQLDQPTPCANWNVGQLVDHLVGAQKWATAGVQGSEMEDAEGVSQGDYNAAFAAAAQDAQDAFSAEGAMDRTVNPGFGDMPAAALLGMAVTDTLTHAWDLATATGQDNDLAPELSAQVLEASRQSMQPAFRTEDGSLFGPEQQAPEGANNATKLAAFLGRNV
ncbi:MAG: TIGR03086 family metal-binding protein [Microthrixaceae bacterium]